MPIDKMNEYDFDQVLSRALRSSSQSVPADFTQRMIRQIRRSEERRILARIVLQERLALASCIILAGAVLFGGLVLPDAAVESLQHAARALTQHRHAFIEEIPQTVQVIRGQWQWFLALGAVAGFAVYNLADLWLGKRSWIV